MVRFRWAVADTILIRTILLCLVFIALNIVDAWLTGIAVGAGNYELNPLLGMSLGGNIPIKGLISVGIVTALVLFKRTRLLKPLSLGMLLICVWNGLVVWLWS